MSFIGYFTVLTDNTWGQKSNYRLLASLRQFLLLHVFANAWMNPNLYTLYTPCSFGNWTFRWEDIELTRRFAHRRFAEDMFRWQVISLTYVHMLYRIGLFMLTRWPKNGTVFWYALISSNINRFRFSKSFHCQNQEKIRNNTVTKDPTTPQVCRYPTLWNFGCPEIRHFCGWSLAPGGRSSS